jgi:hypothetical protein
VKCARGPSSEADLARGGVQPSSEADLARGGIQVGRGGHQGCDRLVCAFLGSGISSRFVFFTSLSGLPLVV